MSCSRSTPRHASAKRSLRSPRSASSCSTNAELESESAAPMTSASSGREIATSSGLACTAHSSSPTPPANGNAPNATVQSASWSAPSPNAKFASFVRRSSVSSSPCSKRRKRMPISASSSSTPRSWNAPKPAGPSRPVSKKPRIGDAQHALAGVTTTAAEVHERVVREARERVGQVGRGDVLQPVDRRERRQPPCHSGRDEVAAVGAQRGAAGSRDRPQVRQGHEARRRAKQQQ